MILAIETTGPVCSVALAMDDGRIIEKLAHEQLNHLTELMPMVRDLLAEENAKLADIEAIAVSAGPGSFTGIRIGISAARAMAQVAELPIIKVPTLETFAFCEQGPVAPIFDALRGQVYAGAFEATPRHCERSEAIQTRKDGPETGLPRRFAPRNDGLMTYVPGGIYNPEDLENRLSQIGDITSITDELKHSAANVAKWALAFGTKEPYQTLEPIYMRKAEAERKLEAGELKPKP
jgi:tRNA threonylcarbamoyladenosine biosynthesis protein TsaB